jgi:hypothetical protein
MIDTIRAYLKDNLSDSILEKLKRFPSAGVKEIGFGKQQEIFHVDNMVFIAVYHEGVFERITVEGSLTKFALKNNVNRSTRFTTSYALFKLIHKTGIQELRNFKVTLIDFALNVELRRPVRHYMDRLESASRRYKKRRFSASSFVFQTPTKSRRIRVYDKIKDAQKKKETMGVPIRANRYVLRFEVSMRGNLKELQHNLTLSQACSAILYKKYEKILKEKFRAMKKARKPTLKNISGTPDFMNFLKVKGMEAVGGSSEAKSYAHTLYERGKLTENQLDHINKELDKLSTDGKISRKDPLITELIRSFKLEMKEISKDT